MLTSRDNQAVWTEQAARDYERNEAARYDPEVLELTTAFLRTRAEGGTALELAIGTGRVAIPLAGKGIQVEGIDTSEAMLAELARRGGRGVLGDMSKDLVPGEFSLVYLVFNTLSNLLTQDEQVDCFVNAARHLRRGGCFVIECLLPDLQRLPRGETAVPFEVTAEHVGIDTYDLVNQQLVSHHYYFRDGGTTTSESPHRWAWPSEMDLMARIAGMSLAERYADWDESAFTDTSRSHVSVWRKG